MAMSNHAIQVENLSKQYRLGQVGTGTISHDLNRFWHRIRGKEDPYLQVGEANDRTQKGSSEYVWSLRDVNFDIEKGDAVGIIGRNGAGKSTLLKILSKVTKPTTGSIRVNGRIASLLEVGTGFNPEMTGRENIYLNGAILGMRKHEIDRKLDQIVDFSGVERYLDTPVKRYSSGMYVRLAFAVAAHLESEILIVDEVLAVGDAEFQKKCLGKMGEVSKGEGRTVLFVSHNMGAVRALCKKAIWMHQGNLKFSGEVEDTISAYLAAASVKSVLQQSFEAKPDLPVQILNAVLLRNGEPADSTTFDFLDRIGFEMIIEVRQKIANRGIIVHCNDTYERLFQAFDISVLTDLLDEREPGTYRLTIDFPAPIMKEGFYSFDLEVGYFGKGPDQYVENAFELNIEVLSRNPRFQSAARNRPVRFYIEPNWRYEKIS